MNGRAWLVLIVLGTAAGLYAGHHPAVKAKGAGEAPDGADLAAFAQRFAAGSLGDQIGKATEKIERANRDRVKSHPVRGRACPVPGGRFANDWHAPRSGGRKHKGTDIFAPAGTEILAFEAGRVVEVESRDRGLGGRVVWIKSKHGRAYYAHNSRNEVTEGERVKAGQLIARVGKSGNARSTPAHLHFGYRPGTSRNWTNPYPLLKGVC